MGLQGDKETSQKAKELTMIIPVITYEVKPVVLKPWPKVEKIKPVKKSNKGDNSKSEKEFRHFLINELR